VKRLTKLASFPEHLSDLQQLVNRCPDCARRKRLICEAALCEAITADEASLMISANQLETA
jgi:hypothetical protein